MKESAGRVVKVSTVGQEPIVHRTWRNAADSMYLVDTHASSEELLQRVSDLVDGIARLSSTTGHLSLNIGQSDRRTILEHAQKLLSVTGTCREIESRPMAEKSSVGIPK